MSSYIKYFYYNNQWAQQIFSLGHITYPWGTFRLTKEDSEPSATLCQFLNELIAIDRFLQRLLQLWTASCDSISSTAAAVRCFGGNPTDEDILQQDQSIQGCRDLEGRDAEDEGCGCEWCPPPQVISNWCIGCDNGHWHTLVQQSGMLNWMVVWLEIDTVIKYVIFYGWWMRWMRDSEFNIFSAKIRPNRQAGTTVLKGQSRENQCGL